MRKIKMSSIATIIAISSSLLTLSSCQNSSKDGFLTSKQQKQISSRLSDRSWIPEREKESSVELQQAMDFLYAYMPYGDVADYSEDLYRTNSKSALKARSEMPWGDIVTDDLFMHFILPVRVNNENLDTSRCDFYAELKERVKDLSMIDAILETNHWCLEKATYTPSDARTLAPGALVKNALGRCGEESTFTVTALRSIGIPARQIYVPRWAHTDDNHAWVEAWADGKWYFIGACEPEAVVNRGWFEAPAKRSLLMFTKVFGDYSGNESIISREDSFTEINVTENYTPVKEFSVIVKDTSGAVVEGAEVLFNIFNYGEQYTAIRQKTDKNGTVTFVAGLGDVMLSAKSNGAYGEAKIDLRTSDSIEITIDKNGEMGYSYSQNIVPPASLPTDSEVTAEQAAENDRRSGEGSSLRGKYVATFLTADDAAALAEKISQPTKRIERIISQARGNGREIYQFFIETPAEKMDVAVDLLEAISVKDLKDTPKEILRDHLDGAYQYRDKEHFKKYILNPRIDYEILTPYRSLLSEATLDSKRPQTGFDNLNVAKVPVSPLGVYNLMMADKDAYVRYMIALYRSCGIAARKEPLTERPQFFDGTQWQLIELPWAAELQKDDIKKGTLAVRLADGSPVEDPKYYSQFTLAKLNDGEFRTLDMRHTVAADMGAGISYKTLFAKDLELEVGTYQLTTSTRIDDGTSLIQCEVFVIEDGKRTSIPMVIRQNSDQIQFIGKIDTNLEYTPSGKDSKTSLSSAVNSDYFIVAMIDAQREPTNHFFRGLEAIKGDLEAWGAPIILVLRNSEEFGRFSDEQFPNLPSTISYGYDSNDSMTNKFFSMLNLETPERPVVALSDKDGNVVYISVGYNTSVRDQIKSIISKL